MNRTQRVALAAALLMALCGIFSCAGALSLAGTIGLARGEAVAVVRVEGVISSGADALAAFASGTTDEQVKQGLRRAEEDPSVKSILLYINSPGGSVVASDEIYRAVRAARKPVIAFLGETAASGGYYVACGADWIVAHPGSLTGSIGVIVELIDAHMLLQKLGVTIEVVKSGPAKDMGSFARPLTPEERSYLEAVVEDAFSEFVSVVAAGRGMPEEQVRRLADGRVMSGAQAVRLGLADEEGSLEDAVARAARMGGIAGQPRVVDKTARPTFWELLTQLSRGLQPLSGVRWARVEYRACF